MARASSTTKPAKRAKDAAGRLKVKRQYPRPASSRATNAPLQTPRGGGIGQFNPGGMSETRIRTSTKQYAGATNNLLERACAHLCAIDPRLGPVIEQHHCSIFSPAGLQEEIDPFNSLCSSIMSQQVSGAAAASIKRKFIALFSGPDSLSTTLFPQPVQVAAMDTATLRTAGLSLRKAEYIQGLAQNFASGQLSARMLMDATDEELLAKLTAIRGLGKWSVEMFACFALKRIDIFSTGDLGVQRGMAVYQGRNVSKLKAKGGKWKYMSEQEMLEISSRFAPYR